MRIRTCLVFVFCFAFAISAFAQQQGAITGFVSDPQGAVIPGAKVTARNNATNVLYETSTSSNGSFTIPGLPYGVYTVEVAVEGFSTWQSLDVRVITGQAAIAHPVLEVGAVTEVVTVESGQETLETETIELQSNISRKQLIDLPLLTRSPTDLINTLPGVTGTSAGVRSSHFNGLRGGATNLTQDGINAMDNFVKTSGIFAITSPTVESTGEFSISSQNIGAESGFGVGQVRLSTPRGTNEYHGSVFYFHRNDKFNAADFFDNIDGRDANGDPITPKEREREHRFGFAASGPVWIPKVVDGRDNSFWFFRYEGFRENAATNRNRTVLTSTARQGLFSYVDSSGVTQTVDLLASSTRGFPLNPFTLSLINATPLPNNTQIGDDFNTGGHSFGITEAAVRDRYAFRADQKVVDSEKFGEHWVEVVYTFVSFSNKPDTFNGLEAEFPEGVAQSCLGGICIGASQKSERKLLSTAIHSTFGPTVFNEARFGFNRAPVGFLRDEDFPRAFRVDFDAIQTPEQNFLSQGRQTPVYQFNDNLTKVAGSHTVKMGFTAMSVSGISFNDSGIIPQVDLDSSSSNSHGLSSSLFPGASTGDITRARQIYTELVGMINTSAQTFNGTPGNAAFTPGASNELFIRERSFAAYVSDAWRVRSNLTLNYGLRFELVKPPDVVNRRAVSPIGGQTGLFVTGDENSLFNPDASLTFADILAGTVTGPQLIASGTSNGVPFWDTDWNNFAPFAGAAWSINPRTVLRAGASLSYTREGITLISGPLGSNTGLRSGLSENNVLVGIDVIDPSFDFAIVPPALRLPFSQVENFINGSGGMFTFDRNLRTPYVVQWSFGLQRELTPSTVLEVRYVGNHGVKLTRAIDLNQIDIVSNNLIGEFALAQQNLACNGGGTFENLGTACNVAMPVLDALQMNTPTVINLYASSSRITDLNRNQVGQFWHGVSDDCTFFRFAFDGAFSAGDICPGLDGFAANFFRANPFGVFMDSVGNHSRSSYHGLQVEVRRRFAQGLMFNGNYTFGKVLTDFGGDVQNEFEPYLDLRQRDYDYRRAPYDVRHVFHFNGVWEVPLGRGRSVASEGVLGKFLEGWQIGSISTWRTGAPVGIFSNRGTLNRNGRSSNRNAAALVGGTTVDDVCDAVDVYKEDDGVFFLPPQFRASNGQADSSILGHPGAAQLGAQGLRGSCSRPGFFSLDMNFVKRTYFTETANVEVRFEFFNILNHPTFQSDSTEAITSSLFAKINGGYGGLTSRQVQFNIRVNF